MAAEFEFDWDEANVGHLSRHGVEPREFEEVILGGPLNLDYQTETGEDRGKSLGATPAGRVLIAIWAVRQSKIRAITAYPANRRYRDLYRKLQGA